MRSKSRYFVVSFVRHEIWMGDQPTSTCFSKPPSEKTFYGLNGQGSYKNIFFSSHALLLVVFLIFFIGPSTERTLDGSKRSRIPIN